MPTKTTLQALDRLVGSWITEATHPALPGVVVHGTAEVAWLEGERFLILRTRNDHPDFPDAVSIIGYMDADRAGADAHASTKGGESRLAMHYFDSRGVFRVYGVDIDTEAWRMWRDAPGFSQRFDGSFTGGGETIVGQWLSSEDGVRWEDDLRITFRHR
jgi:hypothetical protein